MVTSDAHYTIKLGACHPAAVGRVYAAYGRASFTLALLRLLAVDSIKPKAADHIPLRGGDMTGGYGFQRNLPDGTPLTGTLDKLTAIDLPGVAE